MANAFEEFGPPAAAPAPRKSNRAPDGSTFYDDIRSVIEPHGGRITSTNGGRHNVGSTHYSGGAVDVGMGRETPEQQETIKAQLLAAGYQVRDERSRPRGQAVWSGPHLHITRPRGGSGGGGGGGVQGAPAANPFAEFDAAPAPSLAEAVTGSNPFAEFDAPDFSNVQTAIGGTEAPDYSAAFTDGIEDPSSLGKIGLRALVGRIPTLTANLVELPGNVAGAVGDALGGTMIGATTRAGFDKAGELVRALGYENDMQAAGYGAPSVTGGQVLDAINPMADVPLGERASRVANFIPETLVGSSPDMLAAVGALPAYIGARTNEVAENRAANDQRANPSLTDLAVAAPAATAESLLERLTTLRLLPGGGGAAVRPGVAAAAGRVAKETGLQGATGAVEEAIPYLAETLGTQAPTTGRGLAEALATGLVSEGALGGGAQGVKEAAAAIPARAQPAPTSLADLVTPPPSLPAVAAEGVTAPRQGVAQAAPPTPAVAVEKQEVAPPKQAAETPTLPVEKINTAPAETAARPDMAAATRSIDDRLAALDDTAAGQIPESAVSALNTERQELDDLLREQDRAKREGIVQPLEARLSPEERATADARRTEIAATLERHRAARTAADQAQRLRTRLENTDSDAGLFEVAREINPTLGTPQAESFRAPAVKEESAPKTQASPPAAPATPSVSVQAPSAPIETNAGTTPNGENVGDRSAQSEPIVGQRARSEQPSAPPAAFGKDRLDIRAIAAQNTERGELDATKAAAGIVQAVQARLDRGDRVTMYRDGKPVEITGIERGMMQDAAGQRWGTMALFTEKGDANRIEFTPNAATPPTETGIPVSPRAESQREPAAVEPVLDTPTRTTSLKNVVTDAERVADGRDPIIRAARKGNRETVDEAVRAIRETPSIGRETAARLAEGGPVELKDEAVLLVHKVDLRKRRDAAAERAQSPNVSEEARAIARREYDDAVQQIDEVDQAASRIGTESGRLLQLRKRMIAEDYSMPALERKLRMVVNRDLKPAEQAEIKELADKVATLQRKLDAVESQQASAQVAEMLARLMKQAPGKNATLAERRAAAMESKAALSAMSSTRAPQRSIPEDRPATARSGAEAFRGMTREQFLGKPRITRNANAADLRPSTSNSLEDVAEEPFLNGRYTAKIDDIAAAVFDGEKVIASYDKWATLVVDKKYRNQGIGAELVYQFRTRNPGMKPATDRTKAAQALQEKVWSRVQRELSAADSERWSRPENTGKPGQARAALADRLGRGVVARLERAGVLVLDDRSGGTWDGTRIGIGNVSPENALGVLLHEVAHANMLDVLGEQGYERALRDLDALEAAGDPLALKAKKRAAKSGETGQRLDDERIAYMVEEATNAEKPAPKVTEFVRSLFSAFRRWAATSAVFRALEKIGVDRPTLKPADFAAFARKGLGRMVADAKNPESAGLRGKVRELETQLRTNRLTGLPNRLAFDEDAALSWPTVAFFDVDSFKKLNDQVGHDPADVVLKLIGEEVKKLGSAGIRPYHVSGDEFLFRFKSEADAKPLLDKLQDYLEGVTVELETRDADNNPRFFEYQGIGISYGVGANYDQADSATKLQKQSRLESGAREEPRGDGPSRRIRESAARPGGRRESDPPAVGVQRSVPDQTQTPAFKRWFGKSKVVDANGEPLVVYHGTNDRITTFDPQKSGGMFWFSENRDKIASGESGAVGTSRIIPVYLKAEKLAGWDEYERLTTDQLIAQGFDGVKLDDDYIVFDPEQIKSATGNRGTFDPADPNIMRSIPEGEDAAPAGADPVAFFHLARMGAFHYADGARTEAEWTKRMEGDLGPAADRYRSMLPDAFKASKAQADRVAKGPESVAEAVEAIGDQRRPRDVKRVVRAVVAEGMRGEDAIISATAQALDMDDADVRTLFVQSEPKARTLTEAQAELKELRLSLKRENAKPRKDARAAMARDQKEMREAQREAMRPDPETRYQDTRARDFQRRIADLEARIAAGDFAKREKTEHDLVERNKRLQFELEKTKERFHRYAIAAEFAMRTPLGKLWGETYAGINFARAIMTSLDLSAVFRQGGFIALGNPARAAKGIAPMLRAFASEKADFEAMQDINNRPNAPLYKKYGLELTGIGGDALSRTEEAYASRWVEQWSKWAGGGLIRGSGRAYTAFLNRLRADSFDAMLAALARDGSNPTKEEGLAIANYINVATGRAGGIAKNPGEVLTATFFAPRLVASRFQLLAGQPLYGGSKRTRKLIAQEYVRFMIGVSVAVTLAAMMRDEDDETKVIEVDPRSANFGKVRFGKETFLDPLAGLAQVSVFLARMATGEARQTKNDKLVPLRNKWRITDVSEMLDDGYDLGKVRYGGADVPQEIMRFMRTKLAPVPGALFNALAAEDMIGQETELTDEVTGLITPMSVGSLVDVIEAQGMARGTAINLLGILGMSVQYRKSDEEKAVEEENGVAGAFGFGTADRSTDEQP